MKIALCKSRVVGPVSGADETLVTYADCLRRAGHDVHVVLLFPHARSDPYYKRLAHSGVTVTTIVERAWMFSLLQMARRLATHMLFVFVLVYGMANHMRGLWTTILHFVSHLYGPRCRRFFRTHRYEAVHIITYDSGTPVLIKAAHGAGLPVVYQELGSPHHPDGPRHQPRLARVIPLCTSVVALSPRLARDWSQRMRHPLGYGVLPLVVSPPTEWNVPERPRSFNLVIGFSGRLERLKGILPLIDAFAAMHAVEPNAYLRIAGEGPQSYAARRRCHELGVAARCEFVGRYAELDGRSAFFSTLDMFILPTLVEGTPNSIVEAMASGVPVIASAVGGIPDMISDDIGILVPPGDVDALAAAMLRLARDPVLRGRMGTAARARYERLFGPEAVLPMLVHTYDEARGRIADAATQEAARPRPCLHPWGVPGPPQSDVALA